MVWSRGMVKGSGEWKRECKESDSPLERRLGALSAVSKTKPVQHLHTSRLKTLVPKTSVALSAAT